MKFILIALFVSSITLYSDTLDCKKDPGKKLCKQVQKFKSYLKPCSSDACYSLWSDQLALAKQITDYYYDELPLTYKSEKDLYDIANNTAHALCKYEVEGERAYISALIVSYNRLLDVLIEIQKASGGSVKTCRF